MNGLIDALASPLPIAGAAIALGLGLAGIGRWRRQGLALAWIGLAAGLLLGNGWVADMAARRWERAYSPARPAALRDPPRWIVVLAGGAHAGEPRPPAAALSESSLYRVAEGVRLQRALPGAMLVLMDGTLRGTPGARSPYAAAAAAIGGDTRRMLVLAGARNTAAEARRAAGRLPQGAALYLVSDAVHLPRAELLFRRAGLAPMPAPARFFAAARGRSLRLAGLVPRAEHARTIERILHEQLGLWALRLPF